MVKVEASGTSHILGYWGGLSPQTDQTGPSARQQGLEELPSPRGHFPCSSASGQVSAQAGPPAPSCDHVLTRVRGYHPCGAGGGHGGASGLRPAVVRYPPVGSALCPDQES